jgi:phosphoribosylformimino-5-aminoimidazole carboxamide ribotide isomerase
MLAGPAFSLYKEIKSEFPSIQLIASGGVGKISDVKKLCAVPVDGVIIGKALYEGAISLKDLAQLRC